MGRFDRISPRRGRRRAGPGFTLVELLVVVAIVAVLLALTIPAVQKAREAANYSRCGNNLHQIGIAFHLHHDQHRAFPSGGWGWAWIGTPARGSGPDQTGGWVYNILPYIGQAPLRSLGVGEDSPQLEESTAKLVQTTIAVMVCPSRRSGGPYPADGRPYLLGTRDGKTTTVSPVQLARGDYAANSGSQGFNEIDAGPSTIADGDNPNYSWPGTSLCTGITFPRSAIQIRQILRGTSNTLAAGERYLNPEHYEDGMDVGDNESMYVGFDNDTCRVTLNPPKRDVRGRQDTFRFGSVHPGTLNLLYCDGSVRSVGYDVDPDVFTASGSRNQ
ncbi:MAG TPA: DUF1559 domain-containing protein [Gemmataceae bacterium]|jgi:prepilin-type N-terminal cleavage/methylation domain-containing protein/prepilin-type processing-associated H-X9-DG protein|nr:DUF1559 domain-containing protein [Gemmataceae bacterium]